MSTSVEHAYTEQKRAESYRDGELAARSNMQAVLSGHETSQYELNQQLNNMQLIYDRLLQKHETLLFDHNKIKKLYEKSLASISSLTNTQKQNEEQIINLRSGKAMLQKTMLEQLSDVRSKYKRENKKCRRLENRLGPASNNFQSPNNNKCKMTPNSVANKAYIKAKQLVQQSLNNNDDIDPISYSAEKDGSVRLATRGGVNVKISRRGSIEIQSSPKSNNIDSRIEDDDNIEFFSASDINKKNRVRVLASLS